MTTQTAVLSAPTGLTLTAKLFTLAAPDTTAFTADSVTERTNAKGQYVASFGEASAISGDYTLILFSGTRPVAIGYRTFMGTDGETATETATLAELDSASIDAIWDEVLTGATHNIPSSAGRRLRQLADTVVLVDGVCDAAGNAGTDSTGTITLEVGTTTACVGQAIRCENQVRYIASYDAGTRVAQLDRPWCVVPDAGDEYVIFNVRNPLVGLASLALSGSHAAVMNEVLVDTSETLPELIAGIEGGGGGLTGPYTRTITVTDADTDEPIEGAKVRLYRTGETGTLATDVNGVASFTVEAATWLYAIAASGYAGVSGSVVVSANGNTDVQMEAVSITPPSNPSLSAIVVLCLDAAGQPEPDVNIDIRIVTVPSGSQNTAYKGAKQTATSDADGIARFEVVQGSICEWKRGRADVWSRVTIDSDSVTNVTSVIGSP
jgi:hypothetical protein